MPFFGGGGFVIELIWVSYGGYMEPHQYNPTNYGTHRIEIESSNEYKEIKLD